jgi:hypothetical protein
MSRGLFDEDQRSLLIGFLAAHPLAGDLMPGTGGVRKLRWAVTGRGKTGWSARHLLRAQRESSAILAHSIREECAGGFKCQRAR